MTDKRLQTFCVVGKYMLRKHFKQLLAGCSARYYGNWFTANISRVTPFQGVQLSFVLH